MPLFWLPGSWSFQKRPCRTEIQHVQTHYCVEQPGKFDLLNFCCLKGSATLGTLFLCIKKCYCKLKAFSQIAAHQNNSVYSDKLVYLQRTKAVAGNLFSTSWVAQSVPCQCMKFTNSGQRKVHMKGSALSRQASHPNRGIGLVCKD